MDPSHMTGMAMTWIVISVAASTAATAFSIAWARSARRVRELEAFLVQRDSTPADREMGDEMARRLDDVAEQVNRLADGQDFLARLVSDRRLDAPRPRSEPPRTTTPH